MAGLYIHIPFCRQACNYCNFHFATSLRYKNELVQALLDEIRLRKGYLGDEPVETIYLGGGTPSLLSIEDCRLLIESSKSHFSVLGDAEITIETNPDDITDEKLAGWKESGINRLSIGIQSFFDEDLQWMNRAHSSGQAISSLLSAIKQFSNITIDLIYGTPLLTDEKWKQNVDTIIQLNIPHISCYALTIEPKTPLDKLIKQKQKEDIDPEKQTRHFLQLMDWLNKMGYEHYEISNFAKPGHYAKHNTSYWLGEKYLGIGPSAHSYDGQSRYINAAHNPKYIAGIQEGKLAMEVERLSMQDKFNEAVMTGLRTMWGVSVDKIKSMGEQYAEHLQNSSLPYIDRQQMRYDQGHFILTEKGKLFADGIASDLFWVDD
jgi:oxygen-independent coproporphyrinogen-3 oxidase